MPPVKYRPPGPVAEDAAASNALGNAALVGRDNEDFVNGRLEARPRATDSFVNDIILWFYLVPEYQYQLAARFDSNFLVQKSNRLCGISMIQSQISQLIALSKGTYDMSCLGLEKLLHMGEMAGGK